MPFGVHTREPGFIDVERLDSLQIAFEARFRQVFVQSAETIGPFRMPGSRVVCLIVGVAYEGDGFQVLMTSDKKMSDK